MSAMSNLDVGGQELGQLLDDIDGSRPGQDEANALRAALDYAVGMLVEIGVEIPRGGGETRECDKCEATGIFPPFDNTRSYSWGELADQQCPVCGGSGEVPDGPLLDEAGDILRHLDRVHGVDPNTVEPGDERSKLEQVCDCADRTHDEKEADK